ncbi:phospholipase B, plb1, putative [Pediculus humanus corporis]|uniref:Phospholipase B, plb1, putative n=1 Tax=Pediculus humanus subsp. corporis TaxID=121224 RepID=E0W2N9_PEDHC|nr:phospholipase B, plb1, putative [Pediculus humanus corporis]EEB19895.1 phospholipase B, plb1, putative [Pediculus humanus corporis]
MFYINCVVAIVEQLVSSFDTMKITIKIFLFFALFADYSMTWNRQESTAARNLYKIVRNVVFKKIGRTGTRPGLLRAARQHKLQPLISENVPFPCDVTNGRSPKRPISVHELRPGDIDVIGSLGDSLTAGNGVFATNIFEVATENRGATAYIGGQSNWREFLTLPNILKEFNPNLIGYSLGDGLGHHPVAEFNVAEPAAMSGDLPFMVKELVRRIKLDRRVDIKNDWKLINIFIGANDFCLNFCYLSLDAFKNSAETHRRQLMMTTTNYQKFLLIFILGLDLLYDLKSLPRYCDTVHLVECPCLFGISRKRISYKENIEMQNKWRNVQIQIANDERYKKKNDFSVVTQTFALKLDFPKIRQDVADASYLSPDCFHLSQKGNARSISSCQRHLDNMLEPVGNKSINWRDTFTRFLCPTEKHPYIFTYKNSLT